MIMKVLSVIQFLLLALSFIFFGCSIKIMMDSNETINIDRKGNDLLTVKEGEF